MLQYFSSGEKRNHFPQKYQAAKTSVSPRFMALGGFVVCSVFFQHKNINLIYLLINEN